MASCMPMHYRLNFTLHILASVDSEFEVIVESILAGQFPPLAPANQTFSISHTSQAPPHKSPRWSKGHQYKYLMQRGFRSQSSTRVAKHNLLHQREITLKCLIL